MKRAFRKTRKIIFIVFKYSAKIALYCFLFSGALCLGILTASPNKKRRKNLYRMPRGYGWVRDPKKYFYNKQYNIKRKFWSGKL